jgi:hypothetical protein
MWRWRRRMIGRDDNVAGGKFAGRFAEALVWRNRSPQTQAYPVRVHPFRARRDFATAIGF